MGIFKYIDWKWIVPHLPVFTQV